MGYCNECGFILDEGQISECLACGQWFCSEECLEKHEQSLCVVKGDK